MGTAFKPSVHIRGYYAVIDRDDEDFARKIVFECGASVVQLRMKDASARELLPFAQTVAGFCEQAKIPFVVNDRIDVALAVHAHGVHLGQDDLPLVEAKKIVSRMGASLFIGISTHSLAQVGEAVKGGADYLGYGPVFATRTKKNPDPTQGIPALIAAVEAAQGVPITAIGGITTENVHQVAKSGAGSACAIQAVNGAANMVSAAQKIAAAFRR